ncbi:MAG: hypothetical protein CMM94_05510 [Rickettsiales bacterium]|nr:hypothetical protein [Rickettsiales bacterium]
MLFREDIPKRLRNTQLAELKLSGFIKALALVLLFGASLGAGRAHGNPDVWVTAEVIFRFEDTRVSGLTYVWRFDDYYSSRTIQTYDSNQDGILGRQEVARLRADSFDPLAQFDYYVHIWENGEKRQIPGIEDFNASIESAKLLYRFTVPLIPPADPSTNPIAASLFDDNTVLDFRFSETDFLLVDGSMGSDCKFRLAPGKGTRSKHTQIITLNCGG